MAEGFDGREAGGSRFRGEPLESHVSSNVLVYHDENERIARQASSSSRESYIKHTTYMKMIGGGSHDSELYITKFTLVYEDNWWGESRGRGL